MSDSSRPDSPRNDPKPTRRDFLAGAAASLAAFGLPQPLLSAFLDLEANPGGEIDSVRIFPPIGISRVGGSEQWYHAPEVPGVSPRPADGKLKEGNTRLKKQVQRFFLFGFDAQGRVVRELTANDADIRWTVRVANSKAAWYGFNNPFDLWECAPGISALRHNPTIFGTTEDGKSRREDMLIIDSGEVSIEGADRNRNGDAPRHELAGTFWKGLDLDAPRQPNPARTILEGGRLKVVLGALRTDSRGRLEVVPGEGISGAAIPNDSIVDFTQNDAWHDDWCDGWVKARVTLGGRTLEAAPAWVACCGPNYAPAVTPFTNMYDTIHDTMIRKYADRPPAERKVKRPDLPLSFSRTIYPMFHRLGQLQWVSKAAQEYAVWFPEAGDFSDPAYIATLADPAPENRETREAVFALFREPVSREERLKGPCNLPSSEEAQKEYMLKLPYMLGSGVNFDDSPDRWFVMTETQYWILEQWRDGNFVDDFADLGNRRGEPQRIEDVPLEDRPEALLRAALEPLSAGSFHPGVELTWVLRQPQLFDDEHPYRIALGNRSSLEQDIGKLTTVEGIFPPDHEIWRHGRSHSRPARDYDPDDYPIGPQMPGDLTRWMGLPWQPDAFSCQGVELGDFPAIAWWPALLPIDVLPEYAYQKVLDTNLSRAQRLAYAADRVPWARGVAGLGYHVSGSYMDGLNRMIYLWEHMGVVVRRPVPEDLRDALPPELYVEVDRGSMDLSEYRGPQYVPGVAGRPVGGYVEEP